MITGTHFYCLLQEYNRKAQGEVNSNEAMSGVCVGRGEVIFADGH